MDDLVLPSPEQRRCTVVIVPALDPGDALVDLVFNLRGCDYAVVVVDDGSTAVTEPYWAMLRDGVVVVHHERNWGKGEALKTGLRYAACYFPQAGCFATIDADGQHRLRDLHRVVCASWDAPGALVLGSRELGEGVPRRSLLGNRLACRSIARIFGVSLRDTQTGLRAFDGALAPFMERIAGSRFEYETNVLLTCASAGVPLIEIPVEAVYRDGRNDGSHYRSGRDTLRIGASVAFIAVRLFVTSVGKRCFSRRKGIVPVSANVRKGASGHGLC